MVFTSLFAFLVAATSISQAAVVPPGRTQGKPNCITVHSGYLSADVKGHLKSFTTSSSGDMLDYKGDGQNPLQVEFQACLKPGEHLGSGGGGGVYTGRLFVPSVKKCVDIPGQAIAPPYLGYIQQCQETGPDVLPIVNQNFVYQTAGGDNIYFSGTTYLQGGAPQGNCTFGLVGFQANIDGVPATTKQGQVFLGCYNMGTQAFRLSDKSA